MNNKMAKQRNKTTRHCKFCKSKTRTANSTKSQKELIFYCEFCGRKNIIFNGRKHFRRRH